MNFTMKEFEDVDILRKISSSTVYTLATVSDVFDEVQSYDDTILVLYIAARNNQEPTTIINTLNNLGVTIKWFYHSLINNEPK
ncbi:MAG: hypothetical protein GY777_29530 [Candidatus Brocadiaceae bacterium]|nr:hypothetical protein [Candidatus Brocadiaceae bacterium]